MNINVHYVGKITFIYNGFSAVDCTAVFNNMLLVKIFSSLEAALASVLPHAGTSL
jgi:hypothetical protein